MQKFADRHSGQQVRGLLAPKFADHIDSVVLAAGTLYRHPVPANARHVVMSFSGRVWVRPGSDTDVLSIPDASLATGQGAELNPNARELGTASHLLFIAPADCVGSLSFYG